MRLSRFDHAKDTKPKVWETDWEGFTRDFGPHALLDVDVDAMSDDELRHFKEVALAAFSPAEYPEGGIRKKEHVLRVHLLVLDIDDKTDDELADFVERADGMAMVVCSTFSRGRKPGARARVVIPLSRPVAQNEWDIFWKLTNALFEGIGDPQCKDPNRLYFGVFAPRSKADEHFYEVFDGEPLDVDEVMGYAPSVSDVSTVEKVQPVTREQLRRFADSLVRKSDDYKAETGHMLRRVCDGEAFAEPGSRHDTLIRMSLAIMKRFPDGDTASIAEHFRQSIELMTAVDASCPPLSEVEYTLSRDQKIIKQERLEAEQRKLQAQRKRIVQAFGAAGVERSEPYSDEELRKIGDVDWVVQRGKSFYLFNGQDYVGPFTDSDAGIAALSILAPAQGKAVELFGIDAKGNFTRRPIIDLVAAYGSVANEVRMDLRAQKSTFDSKRLIFVEAPCPMRDIKPAYHPKIAKWIELLGGDKAHQLRSWIAAVTLLDKPCVALFLTGPKGVGKSLLAEGLSRIWTTEGPSDLEEVFSNFNDSLARCPLCFADEQLPKDIRGYTKSGELRAHIQARSRPFKRKFLPSTRLLGATRTLIAANNHDILRTQESLTANDIGAIVDRYLHRDVSDEARAYLEDVDTYGEGWVENDLIAQHALWLRDNYEWQSEGRFLIKVTDQKLARGLATAGGANSSLCQWLVNYLKYPDAFHSDPKSKGLVQVDAKGKLLVNVEGVMSCWDKYVPNERCPSTGRLSTALTAVSHPQRAKRKNSVGVLTNFRIVDVENLMTWAETTGFATREEILDALTKETVVAVKKDTQKMN